jgi:site-specific DNA recombinase
MNKVVIYARVSSKEQEAEGYSIPAQITFLKEYASKNSYSISKEFTDVETAKKAGRTQFNNMLNFVKEHPAVKNILVEKTDRLLRNISDYALIDRLMESSDIKIHLVKENVILSRDSRSNEKFIFGIKALMAKNYVDNLSEEVKKGMEEKAKQGIFPTCAPYGYLNVRENGKKTIAVDTQAAPFVKQMFKLYATGSYSLSSLKKKIIDDGMIYKNGKNFHKSTLETILKNPFYTGIFLWNGTRYENASHEAIISNELFNLVQEKLLNPYKSKSKKALFPYTNLITCGVCGCSLTAEIKKGKYIYYHCTGYKGNCKQPYIKQEVIEQQFEELLESIHISDEAQEFVLQGIRESFKDKIEYHNHKVAQLEKQIKLLQDRIDQAYLDKLDKKISANFWKLHSQNWIEEKESLAHKLLSSQKADSAYLENANSILELSKNAAVLFKTRNAKQKKQLLTMLLSNCTYQAGKLDLVLKSPFNMIMETSKTKNWCA